MGKAPHEGISMKLHWELKKDLKTVTVTAEVGKSTSTDYTAADIDILIANLRHIRGAMTPEVPMNFSLGQTILHAVPDPRFATEADGMGRGSLLHIRDPGFGWLTYLFPRHEVVSVISYFAKQLAEMPTAPQDQKLS